MSIVRRAPVGTEVSDVRVDERSGSPVRIDSAQTTGRSVQAAGRPRAAAAPVATSVAVPEGGSAVAGGVAAPGTGSAGSGVGLWLALATLLLIAFYFSRLISLPAVVGPVPFISLLERPG